jgi:hypothetical protein
MSRYLIGLLIGFAIEPALAAPPPKPDSNSIANWGKVIDPDGDCKIQGDKDKLTITIPATNHNLHAERGMNAPRVLQAVDENFTATVRVTCELDPGKNPTGKSATAGYYAGLLLWGGEKSYVRLERNMRWQSPNGPLLCFAPGFEYWQDGKMKVGSPRGAEPDFFKGKSTWFRFERKEDRLTASMSHDGKDWAEVQSISVELPKKAQIGVAAINSSDKPFTATFEEFKLAKGK